MNWNTGLSTNDRESVESLDVSTSCEINGTFLAAIAASVSRSTLPLFNLLFQMNCAVDCV